jgi:hypothetical protein
VLKTAHYLFYPVFKHRGFGRWNEMTIKKVIAVGILIALLAPGQAQGGDDERLKLAASLVEKTRQTEMFAALTETFMETYFERYDNPGAENPAAGNPLRKIFQEEVTLGKEELRLMLAETYAAHFKESELKEIVIFFESPAGMAWLEKRPVLQTEGEQIGLEWGQLLMQRGLKRFEEQTGEKF